jgi:hypothetical protein
MNNRLWWAAWSLAVACVVVGWAQAWHAQHGQQQARQHGKQLALFDGGGERHPAAGKILPVFCVEPSA